MIPCAAVGVVVGRGNHNDFGYTAIVLHNDPRSSNDKYTLYAHQPDASEIPAIGTQVGMGDKIGVVGSTGRSTGPHLHFELISLSPGVWWTAERSWRGGATGIRGSTGRLDPLSGANWGGLAVYGGSSETASVEAMSSESPGLCLMGCHDVVPV